MYSLIVFSLWENTIFIFDKLALLAFKAPWRTFSPALSVPVISTLNNLWAAGLDNSEFNNAFLNSLPFLVSLPAFTSYKSSVVTSYFIADSTVFTIANDPLSGFTAGVCVSW